MKLRQTLYSSEFRSYMERIANLPPNTLTERVDCAANCHDTGCHLLCHDDVIGTRCISFIIYLTDPDYAWSDADGGRLELYRGRMPDDHDSVVVKEDGGRFMVIPEAFPCKTILPTFNSMAYFQVTPGVSFHSVQEVFGDMPRLSIQGWYHASEPPQKSEEATLQRLKSTADDEDTEGDFIPLHTLSDTATTTTTIDPKSNVENNDNNHAQTHTQMMVSSEDKSFLIQYINPTYLTQSSMNEIKERFEEESSIQLRHFLNDEWANKINKATSSCDKIDNVGNGRASLNYHVGVTTTKGSSSSTTTNSSIWKAVGPAHKQRFLEYHHLSPHECNDNEKRTNERNLDPHENAGNSLHHLQTTVFASQPFGRFLASMTSLDVPVAYRGRVRRFRPGLDYTVAHHGILTKEPVLDATLCLCAGTGDQCIRDPITGDFIMTENNGSSSSSIGGEYDANHDKMRKQRELLEADSAWESGDVGGFECYIAADEGDTHDTKSTTATNNNDDHDDVDLKQGNDASDEYNEEDDTELLSVSASNNTLSLVYRDPGTMRFVKYVGSRAPSSRWDICIEYKVPDDDGPNDS
mmetsp:Transcript_21810/g.30612  ORF Transcript_21810/g.30612 Transcript_21810/m.30612 type:complete len:579 (-) Transcript_21810:185-1921(-)